VPVVVIVLAILITHGLAGLFGVAIAAMAMLSLAGIVVSIDAYGPITDNAGGIAEMAELGDQVRSVHRPARRIRQHHEGSHEGLCDRVGRPRRGGAVRLLHRRPAQARKAADGFDLSNTMVLAGLFVGAMIPFVFASFAMNAVSRRARAWSRRCAASSARSPGSWKGTAKPDYRTCVDIVTQRRAAPDDRSALIPAAIPIVIGLAFGRRRSAAC
jgi:K(+)-stimulated pyrophosphate-energized sodium pump